MSTTTQSRPPSRGFVTLFVLAMASLVFLVLGHSMQTNRCLQETNRRRAQDIRERAARVTVDVTADR